MTKPALQEHLRMNKLEQKYADYLWKLKMGKEIVGYQYESIKLVLAPRTTYTPDFLVVYPEHFEVHEVKGFARDDAMVKLKVAAQLFPWWRFVLVKWVKGEWVWKPVQIH